MTRLEIIKAIINNHNSSKFCEIEDYDHETSDKLDEYIRLLSDNFLIDPKYRYKFSNHDVYWIIFGVIRDYFKMNVIQTDIFDHNANIIITNISTRMSFDNIIKYQMACLLFNSYDIKEFEIGPVLFTPIEKWLERMRETDNLSVSNYKYIVKNWGKKPLQRPNPSDTKNQILYNIHQKNFMLEFETRGIGQLLSRERALDICSISVTALSIILNQKYEKRYYGNMRNSTIVANEYNNDLILNKNQLTGISWVSRFNEKMNIPMKDWDEKMNEIKPLTDTLADILQYYTSPLTYDSPSECRRRKIKIPIIRNISHALIWHQAASKEQNNLIAAVQYAAALDSLINKGKSGEIVSLVRSRLGLNRDDRIYENGPAIGITIDKLYNHVRNRTVHGSNDEFLIDWGPLRSTAELLSEKCIFSYLERPDSSY